MKVEVLAGRAVPLLKALAETDAVVNLAGRSIFQRWTDLTPEERSKRRAATESAIKDLAKGLMERANAEAARAAQPASPGPAPRLGIGPSPPPVRAQEA